MDFTQIEIERAIVHIVRKPDEDDIKRPVLTKNEAKLDDESKELFREKLVEHIDHKKAMPVKSKKKSIKNIMNNIKKLQTLNNESKEYKNIFIDLSKEIANHYSELIDRRNKDCIVMFFEVKNRRNIKHAILIFELHVGVQAKIDIRDGENVIDIDYIRGLVLSQRTRLFKVAYCVFEDDFDAIICDTQSSKDQIAANYFIDKFLECEFIRIPAIATREFFRETLGFINSISNNELKYKISLHLYSYIHSEEEIIGPKIFVEVLPRDQKQSYLDYFISKKTPLNSFQKDTSTIENEIKKERIDFDDEITLIAPPKQIKEKVKIEKIDDDERKVNVSFQSGIKRIGQSRIKSMKSEE